MTGLFTLLTTALLVAASEETAPGSSSEPVVSAPAATVVSGLSGNSALSLASSEDDGGRNRSLSLSAGVSLISGSVGSLSSVVNVSGLLLNRGGGLGRGLGGVLGSSGSLKSSRGVKGGLANNSSGSSLGLATSTFSARNSDGLVDVASSTTGDERSRDNSGHVSSLLSDGTRVSGLGSRKSLGLGGSSLGNGLARSLRDSLRSTSSCSITRSSGISSGESLRLGDGLGNSL
ncbi:hypothetical protein LB503_001536 [Fusarium chuoi]|nr:hypothetical protein LB503_001536 [Fusarium chuoi]